MSHKQTVKVGWSLIADEALASYGDPTHLRLEKDTSPLQNSYLACPAVRAYDSNFYKVTSPFSLKLRASTDRGTILVQPVYPFTTLAFHLVKQLVQVESIETWPHPNRCIVQIRMPYLFFADESVIIEQSECPLDKKRKMNWRVVPGEFDIYGWQRPVNWSFEWDFSLGDFEVGTGEPMFAIRFRAQANPEANIILQKQRVSEALSQQMKEAAGVSKMRRGTSAVIKKATAERKNVRLVD